ncbi:translocase of chloroplast 101, chloroplastic-like [Oryza brachyantha]|uniref:translocase of chloroplast 101, chloroplastic-like n=1 Tax=Oryza brachyantha TaxID=4533 RepID=UPI001ADB05A2|nr:translocase of chloroplast 101, chloroplastic-like [Oryza brachyantha]
MEVLPVRARLSALDDDDDDGGGTVSSGSSSAATSPARSPSPAPVARGPRAVVLGAPRVAAQLSSTEDDDGEVFDDGTDYEGDEVEVLDELSNGFFRIAKVPPPPSSSEELSPISADEPVVSVSSPSESGYFGAAEGSLKEEFAGARKFADVFDAGVRLGFEDANGGVVVDAENTGVGSSLEGSFQSSGSIIGVFDDTEVTKLGDLVSASDGSPLNADKKGAQDFGAEVVNDKVPEPSVGDSGGSADGNGMHVEDELEAQVGRSDNEVAELPPVGSAPEERDAGHELLNDDSDAKDGMNNHENATYFVDSSPGYFATGDGASELLKVPSNVDDLHDVASDVHHVDEEETDGGYEASDHMSMPTFGTNSTIEIPANESEHNVLASKGRHLSLDDEFHDDSAEEESEVNEKEIEFFDYAALAELLRAANGSPGQGMAKVFPIETSVPLPVPPTMASIPRTNVTSSPVLEVVPNPDSEMTDEERKLYKKVDTARVKYLRLIHRLGYDTEHQIAIQVLYRLSLVEGFRRIRVANHSSELESAWKKAVQLEAEGTEDLEFSCNVLVLGKTGVGKSATINSIFGEDKSKTSAFLPATTTVKEIAGVVGGVKFRVVDTPGLGTSPMDEKTNRKVLNSVKKYIKRCPPDVVLYVDRIDTQRQDANNLSLLRCITSVLGPIWSKTIITLTHSAAAPPEGPSGTPLNYAMAATQRTHSIQQSIRQATNDPRIENTVALVENHHLCRTNTEGEKVLPNGLIWRCFLLLLCYSVKMVTEIDILSTRRASPANLFSLRLQMPPLPYFLSSLLQSREHPRSAADQDVGGVDPDELMDEDEEDDYDQLPPFKPLSKSQVAKLSKEQQKLYFDEYDYRTKLLEKKQLKEQLQRLKEIKREGNNNDVLGDDDNPDDEYETDRSAMPDWALPSSFDSDDPVYRYRCLEPTPNLLVRAVTNPDGWDHDCGFDGVSLQYSLDAANSFPASLWVQVNKDKRESTIHLESSVSAKHRENVSTLAGFDIKTIMDQLAYTLRGESRFNNLKKNTTTGGLSMTFLGDTMVTGAKFEDKLSVGDRLTLLANTGAVSIRGDTAYGVNIEATLRERDYLMGQDLANLGASLVRWRKEWNMAAKLDSQFSLGRASNVAVHVDLNNKLTGRVSIKANTSEQLKIALLGVCSMTMYLWSRMHPFADRNY